jgi:hypothetical protein
VTIGGSLFCITTGAILYFAVTAELAGIDLQVVGRFAGRTRTLTRIAGLKAGESARARRV